MNLSNIRNDLNKFSEENIRDLLFEMKKDVSYRSRNEINKMFEDIIISEERSLLIQLIDEKFEGSKDIDIFKRMRNDEEIEDEEDLKIRGKLFKEDKW